MTTYVVAFELQTPQSREKLESRMKEYHNYCPIHANCWAVVVGNWTAAQIRDDLRQHLQPNERLFVIRSGVEAGWVNSYGEKWDAWLKTNL